jgi:WD40 repeat protein
MVYNLVNHGTSVFGDIQGMVRYCAFTPCSNYIVVVAGSKEITVWSLSTGRMVHRIQTVDQVRGIWFCESPRLTCLLLTGSAIVSVDFENEIQLFRDESAEGVADGDRARDQVRLNLR